MGAQMINGHWLTFRETYRGNFEVFVDGKLVEGTPEDVIARLRTSADQPTDEAPTDTQ